MMNTQQTITGAAKQQSLGGLAIPANTSVDEVAEIVVTRAKERFKNRYLMLHGDDEFEVQDSAGNTRRAVQSWHLFSTKTRKNALDPIANEILNFVLNWEGQAMQEC